MMSVENRESLVGPSESSVENHECPSCVPGLYQFELSQCSELDDLKWNVGLIGSNYRKVGTTDCKDECFVLLYYVKAVSTFREDDVLYPTSAPTVLHHKDCPNKSKYYHQDGHIQRINSGLSQTTMVASVPKDQKIVSRETGYEIKKVLDKWLSKHPEGGYMYDYDLIKELWELVDNDVCKNAPVEDT